MGNSHGEDTLKILSLTSLKDKIYFNLASPKKRKDDYNFQIEYLLKFLEENKAKMPDCIQQWFAEIYGTGPSEKYDAEFWPKQKEQGFELTFMYPTERFKNMGDWYNLPNLGLPNVNARLYDLNVLISRS